jgi:hypothetical protein
MKIFKTNRIRFDEMIADTRSFLETMYETSNRVFTLASPWGQILTVIHDMAQFIFYFNEDSTTESNIYTASRPNSIYGLARLAGHNPMRSIGASGDLRLRFNGNALENRGAQIIIPQHTMVRCQANNLLYVVTLSQEEARIAATSNSAITVKIHQGEIETQRFTGSGMELQSFAVNMKQGKSIDHFFVNVSVQGERYTKYDSLWDMPRGAKGCIVMTGINGGIDIYFGNGFNGTVPPNGSTIEVEYLITHGVAGNLRDSSSAQWKFEGSGFDENGNEIDLNSHVDIKADGAITLGTDPEPTFLTRLVAPKTSRAMVLANPDNYMYFLERLNYFSLVDAFTTFDDDYVDDDNVIYLFLIPDITKRLTGAENYFSVPEEMFTLSTDEKERIIKLIQDSGSMIVTTMISIIDPVVKRFALNISLTTFEGFSKDLIRQEIITKLSQHFLTMRRRNVIPKSDIVAIIEAIEGVDSVNVQFISQENEEYWADAQDDANAESKVIGLDDFGDITIGKGELAIVRGGWFTRDGVWYEDTIDTEGRQTPCSVNIEFKRQVPQTFNTKMNRENIRNLRGGK